MNHFNLQNILLFSLQTGTTALFFAAQAGHIEVAKILIRYGAHIEAASLDGGTPLFVACQGGHINMVKDLIQLGANVHASMKVMVRSINFSQMENIQFEW